MARYGIKTCLTCFGFGLKLTANEIATIRGSIFMRSIIPANVISRIPEEAVRCDNCKGTGWVLAKDYPKITLPKETLKRW